MAKKDGFNFDTGSKFNLNLGSFKSLTKKQKETILIAVIGVVVLAFFVATVILISTVSGGNLGGNNNGGGSGGTGDSGVGDAGGDNGETTDNTIISIVISSKPNKTNYYVGDMADYSGLSVYVERNGFDGVYVDYTDSPDDFGITGFDSSAPTDEQIITVEYKGFTESFAIKVLEIPLSKPTLTSIYLDPAPLDIAKANVSLDVWNAKIVCVYSDGSEKSVTLLHEHLYGYENELINAQVGDVITVYVRYTEDGYIAETSYTVTVIE